MREGLNDVGGNFTAQYGLEAAMPKAAGGHSDPIYQEFSRREKYAVNRDAYGILGPSYWKNKRYCHSEDVVNVAYIGYVGEMTHLYSQRYI
jgi:hypothetical protein